MKKHDCAWCRFENWMFEDFSNVILVIALVTAGIVLLSSLIMMSIVLFVGLVA